MPNLSFNENLERLAKELDFGSMEGLIKDALAVQILARISNFSEEVENFEVKYGKDYLSANKEFETAEEDCQKFDDLMAWRFAQEGKEYWQNRLKELDDV